MRITKKWMSYLLSAALVATSVLPGGVQASAAVLTQNGQRLKMKHDAEGHMVYTLEQDIIEAGLDVWVDAGETVVIDGNGYSIRGKMGAAADSEDAVQAAQPALSVGGTGGTVVIKNISLYGGRADNGGNCLADPAAGVVVQKGASLTCEGDVTVEAGKAAGMSLKRKGTVGGTGMIFRGDHLFIENGSHITVKGSAGTTGTERLKGGDGLELAGASLMVAPSAELFVEGGNGSDGSYSFNSSPVRGGNGGTALRLESGRVDGFLPYQKPAAADCGTIILIPGEGGKSAEPSVVSDGAIGMELDYQGGYVSDRLMIDVDNSSVKTIQVKHIQQEGKTVYDNALLDKIHTYYTCNDKIESATSFCYVTEQLRKFTAAGAYIRESSGYTDLWKKNQITNDMEIFVYCHCSHEYGVSPKDDSSKDFYICNNCKKRMGASITDENGEKHYLSGGADTKIGKGLLDQAMIGETIQLLGNKGTCGEGLTWSVKKLQDSNVFRLIIEGEGSLTAAQMCPWIDGTTSESGYNYIQEMEVKAGVKKIESGAIPEHINISKIELANGIELEKDAFTNATPDMVQVMVNAAADKDLTKETLVEAGIWKTASFVFPVTFNGNNNEEAKTEYYDYGATVTPAAITYSGHTLQGWYRDAAFSAEKEWNTATDRVEGAMTLYAKWKVNSSSGGGSGSGSGGGSGVVRPAITPSPSPSAEPTVTPSPEPTVAPSETPSSVPSEVPTVVPSTEPSVQPSVAPTVEPSTKPTAKPTAKPTKKPSSKPTAKPAAKGKKIKDSKTGAVYKVTSAKGKTPTVSYYADPSKKNQTRTIVIPKQVAIKGVTYRVTSIAANACRGNKKLTSLTIGSNVKSIGKNAFRGCKNLRKIVIQSKKLTTKSVGKNAFLGISKAAVVQTSKELAKKYRKLLKKKGLPETAKVVQRKAKKKK